MNATVSVSDSTKDLSAILKKTCDDKSLILFESIALSNGNGYIPLKEMNLTVKQYYSRLSGLMKAGLVKKQKGKYSVTILGNIVREAYTVIGQALSVYWKLNALESIESSSNGLPRQEVLKLVDNLIDNHKIKEIIIRTLAESKKSNVSSPNQQVEHSEKQPEARNLEGINPFCKS
jgi:predicted transcriptional regulator